MQLLGIAYGTEEELRAEQLRIKAFLKEKCKGGIVRKVELWDIGFDRSNEIAVTAILPRPHLRLKEMIDKIFRLPVVGSMIKKFAANTATSKTQGYPEFELMSDTRKFPDCPQKSPEFLLICRKNDGIMPDGSEML